jgi:hypothetical protein
LGTSQGDAVRSQARRIIEHCLKLEYSRFLLPRAGWRDSIIDARAELDDKSSPSLRRDLDHQLPRLWTRSRIKAENALPGLGESDAAGLLRVDCAPSTTCLPTAGPPSTATACPTTGRPKLPKSAYRAARSVVVPSNAGRPASWSHRRLVLASQSQSASLRPCRFSGYQPCRNRSAKR